MAANGTQAVDRAALLVSTVVQSEGPLSFADLQEACELPKSTTSRMLTALERSQQRLFHSVVDEEAGVGTGHRVGPPVAVANLAGAGHHHHTEGELVDHR